MTPLETLDLAEHSGLAVYLLGGNLIVEGPSHLITDPIAAEFRRNEILIVYVIRGRASGHAMAPCSTCGQSSLVAILAGSSDPTRCVRRKTWPRCRFTPGCDGRHMPRPEDLERIERIPPPPQAKPPPHRSKQRHPAGDANL